MTPSTHASTHACLKQQKNMHSGYKLKCNAQLCQSIAEMKEDMIHWIDAGPLAWGSKSLPKKLPALLRWWTARIEVGTTQGIDAAKLAMMTL